MKSLVFDLQALLKAMLSPERAHYQRRVSGLEIGMVPMLVRLYVRNN
jgi:hypothetical protein